MMWTLTSMQSIFEGVCEQKRELSLKRHADSNLIQLILQLMLQN